MPHEMGHGIRKLNDQTSVTIDDYGWDVWNKMGNGEVRLMNTDFNLMSQGEDALDLSTLQQKNIIRYIDFPEKLKGKYQSFTEADISALRAAGYEQKFLSVEEGVGRYVGRLLEKLKQS